MCLGILELTSSIKHLLLILSGERASTSFLYYWEAKRVIHCCCGFFLFHRMWVEATGFQRGLGVCAALRKQCDVATEREPTDWILNVSSISVFTPVWGAGGSILYYMTRSLNGRKLRGRRGVVLSRGAGGGRLDYLDRVASCAVVSSLACGSGYVSALGGGVGGRSV